MSDLVFSFQLFYKKVDYSCKSYDNDSMVSSKNSLGNETIWSSHFFQVTLGEAETLVLVFFCRIGWFLARSRDQFLLFTRSQNSFYLVKLISFILVNQTIESFFWIMYTMAEGVEIELHTLSIYENKPARYDSTR